MWISACTLSLGEMLQQAGVMNDLALRKPADALLGDILRYTIPRFFWRRILTKQLLLSNWWRATCSRIS
jgi:hypothetical protein